MNVLFAAGGPPSAFAAKATNTTIPIVFSAVNHPVEDWSQVLIGQEEMSPA